MQHPARLRMAMLTPALWQRWCEHAKGHGYPEPILPEKAIVITTIDYEFVAAVGVHECRTGYIVAEDLVVAKGDELPLSLKAEAAQFVLDALQTYAMISRKYVRVTSQSSGLTAYIAKRGFERCEGTSVLVFRQLEQMVIGSPVFLPKETPAPQEDAGVRGDSPTPGDKAGGAASVTKRAKKSVGRAPRVSRAKKGGRS